MVTVDTKKEDEFSHNPYYFVRSINAVYEPHKKPTKTNRVALYDKAFIAASRADELEFKVAALKKQTAGVEDLVGKVEARKAECERIAKLHTAGDMSLSYDGEARGMDFVLALLKDFAKPSPTMTETEGSK